MNDPNNARIEDLRVQSILYLFQRPPSHKFSYKDGYGSGYELRSTELQNYGLSD